MRTLLPAIFIAITITSSAQKIERLQVSPDGHALQYKNGTPFFWLGDTGWGLFNRLSKEDISLYLDNRQQKGFNVIQAVIADEYAAANFYKEPPFINNDPEKPNEQFFTLVDWAIEEAWRRNMFIGLLPTWGSNVSKLWSKGNVLFNKYNAYDYGLFLGRRYKDYPNIVWIAGGDRPASKDTMDWRPVWRAMIRGIRDGAGESALITYHPAGESSSSDFWKDENILDLNMIQSGHRIHDFPVENWIIRDYRLKPAVPVLDGEPNYEDHPVNWQAKNGYFTAYDVRKQLYRSVFSGACGVTYGHHAIWQFYSKGQQPVSAPDRYWKDALDRPGALQAGYLKKLILSLPSPVRMPEYDMPAFYDKERTYTVIYLPVGKKFTTDVSWLQPEYLGAWWFNPRTGSIQKYRIWAKEDADVSFEPPSSGEGNDWVLIIGSADSKWL